MQHDRVLALGFFDGIHLGHAALLNKTRERARELSLTPAAMSFDTHPDTLVFGTAVPLLNTMAERELLMRRLCGIEEVIFAHFDEAMMHMPWEVFIEDYLVRQLRARHVVCGHDFHFGDRGQGNPDRLREKCRALGVGCDVIPEIQLDGQCVSSTAIRALLRSGDCKTAARLLGHGQLVTGTVQKGAGRGAGLGFPTANLPFSPDVLVPAFGVYRAEAELDGRRYPACVNIGVHPTLGALSAPVLEANLIGFSGNLYGKELAVWLEEHLRGHGTGSTILRQLLTQDKPLILEIEPPEDEITCRRKHFYERNGLCAQPYGHVQLPFQGGGPIVPLVIMSNQNLSAQQCRAFQQYLLNRVVRYTQYRKTLDMADIIDI